MKPHLLQLEAFGPYAEPCSIAFDALSDEGLFLIHGSTGAGKTFLLDALCFALYGEVSGDRNLKGLKSDHAAPSAVPRVSLEFSCGGARYLVERSPAWTHGRHVGPGGRRDRALSVLEVAELAAAITLHTMAESSLVSIAARFTVGTPARDTSIWNLYHALRDLWELCIGAVGAVLALIDPPLLILLVPIVVLAVENMRLEGETRASRLDPRTELLNVRGFEELSAKELERAAELGRKVCLLVLDLDHLREVNNVHGHRAGDAVISVVGRRILASSRRDDVVARVGGEEFVALLPDVGIDTGTRVAERMRASVANSPVDTPAGRLMATLSIGVAEWRAGETVEQLFDRADAAMYVAKQSGRNRVCCSDA